MSDTPQGEGWWQASDGKWYPPEQAPGYQAPQQGYAQPAMAGGGAPGTIDIGEALSYGWNKFVQYIGQVIVILLIIVGVQIVMNVIQNIVSGRIGGLVGILIGLAFSVIGLIISFILQMGLVRMSLMITAGQEPEPGSVFKFDNIGPYAIASILVGLFIFIGFFALCIGAFVVAFFTFLYGFYILDQNQDPMQSITSSFNVIKDNLGSVFLFALVVVALNICTCGLAVGVTQISTGYVYRKLNGQPVAP